MSICLFLLVFCSYHAFGVVLVQILVAFLQVFLYLRLSSIFGHLWFYCHLHIYLGIHFDVNLVILFDHFGGCQNDLPSNFTFNFFFVGNGGGNTPKLAPLLENIPHVDKISRCHNQNLIIRKVNDLGVIVGRLQYLVVFVDVGIEGLLKLEVIQQRLVRFVVGVIELEKIHKYIRFPCFRVLAVHFQRKRVLRHLE